VTYNERDMFDNINNKLIIQQFQKMKPHGTIVNYV